MKKSGKIVTFLCLATAATGVIHVINKSIEFLANGLNALPYEKGKNYKWRFGNVFYTKQGSGTPLLLIHDLNVTASSIEWKELVDEYSKNHTVYAIDLLGCGRSDKPAITYTNYLYVQLISDFIREVIGTRTNLITTGSACSIATMACFSDNGLFDKLIFINPDSLSKCNTVPSHNNKLAKFLFELPIIGTLVYNICHSKTNISSYIKNDCYSNPYVASSTVVDAYYDACHKSGSRSKYLYASIISNYTNISIIRALKEINNSIYIIYGEYEPHIDSLVAEYVDVNPIIETQQIDNTKHLPQLERSKAVIEAANIFLS